MSSADDDRNLIDELAVDAPAARMRARFDELVAEPPAPAVRPADRARWAAAAAAILAIAAVLLIAQRSRNPAAPSAEARRALELLAHPSAFERLRGVNAAAGLLRGAPALRSAVEQRLERDPSVNVRLAALDALLDDGPSLLDAERLSRALVNERTAIVQSQLGFRMRRLRLLSQGEMRSLLERPEIRSETRNILSKLEES